MEKYKTDHEIRFVKGLSEFTPRGKFIGKKNLLKLYISATANRKNWGDIDKMVVLSFARESLREAENDF